MLILLCGVALGAALSALGLRVMILVPVVLALLLFALVDMDVGPVVAALGVQGGYMLGMLGRAWLYTKP